MALALDQMKMIHFAVQVGQDHGFRFVCNDGNPGGNKRDVDACFSAHIYYLSSEILCTNISGLMKSMQLFSIPAQLGGMGVRNPIESAKIAYITSRAGTRNIVDAIKGKMEFSLPDHNVQMSDAMANMHTTLQQQDEVTLHSTLANSELNAKTRRAIQRAVEGKTSSSLTALPIAHHHFDLSATEFRDALALRYNRPLLTMPANCDGCGAATSLVHALDCVMEQS